MTTPAPGPGIRWSSLCLDCVDAEEMARFYGALLGWEVAARDEPRTPDGKSPWIAMTNPSGGVRLLFQAEEWYEPPLWPEQPGAQAKMMHLEIYVEDVASAVEHALAAGGRQAPYQPVDRDPSLLRVMLDPAGHPFCLWTD